MLTSISLNNFKCFQELNLPLRRITVLIGPNGSGKSSVLQALMLFRQSLGRERLLTKGPLADLGPVDDLVHPHGRASGSPLIFEIEGMRLVEGTRARFTYRGEFDSEGTLVANRGSLEWKTLRLEASWPEGAHDTQVSIDSATLTFGPVRAVGTVFSLIGSSLPPGGEADAQVVERTTRGLSGACAEATQSWRFVLPLRGFAQPAYTLAAHRVQQISADVPYDQGSAAIASTLEYDEELRLKVAAWCQSVTGVPIDTSLREGPVIVPQALSPVAQRKIPIVHDGFGTNQLVYLLFELANTPPDGLTCIEEPETHLHPAAIARLGDLLVEVATSDDDKQLLLTTHSDHLLFSLLNNVAEGKLTPDQLAIHYFERKDGDIVVTPVEVTTEGQVKGGLPGFLDAALEAQRRKIEALSRAS